MKKIITIIIGLLLLPQIVLGASTLVQGGTGYGTSTPGDLLVGTTSVNRYSILPAGSTGQVLMASSTSPLKMSWVATSSLGITGGTGSSQWVTSGSDIYYTTGGVSVGTTSTSGYKFNVQGDSNTSGVLTAGCNAYGSYLGYEMASFCKNLAGYVTFTLTNPNAGATSSVDLLFNNDATVSSGGINNYADIGFGSSKNTDPLYTGLGGASSLYFMNTDGDMSFAIGTTSSAKAYRWLTGGYLAANEKMRLTQAGYLGLGTTTPQAPLHIKSSSWVKSALETTSVTAQARLGSDVNGLNFTTNALYNGAWAKDDATKSAFAYIQHLGTSQMEFRVASSTQDIAGSWSAPFRIKDTGELIAFKSDYGTTTPIITFKANLAAAGRTASIRFGDQSQTSLYQKGAIILEGTSNQANMKMHFALENTATSNSVDTTDAVMTLRPGGNIGIGTTTPASKLDIYGTAGSANIFTISSSTNSRLITVGANGSVGIGASIPLSKLEVVASGTPIANADIKGTVGSFEGTTPTGQGSTLSLISNDTVSTGMGGVLGFGGRYNATAYANWASIKGLKVNSTSGEYGGYMSFFTRANGSGSAERMRIDTNGNVGIGTTTPAYKFSVTGNAGTADIAVFASSTNARQLVIEKDGTLKMENEATVWDDISPVLNSATAVNAPTISTKYDTRLYTFSDEAANEDELPFTIQMPHSWKEGSTIYPHVHYTGEDNTSCNFVWGIRYRWTNIGEAISGTTTTATTTSANSATTDLITTTDIATISGTGKTISSMITGTLYRNSTNAGDTCNAKSAYLVGFDVHYEKDTIGSRELLTK